MKEKWWIFLILAVGAVGVYIWIKNQPPPPCSGDDCEDQSVTYGCRVRAQTWLRGFDKKGKNGKVYSSTASTKSKASRESVEAYKEEFPGADKIDVNCWDCDNPEKLEPIAREACEE
jgi:hypothetical protein